LGAVGSRYDRDGAIRNGGGNVPMIVQTLVFDTTQITSPGNYSHPKWGGVSHPLTSWGDPPTVIIARSADDDLSEHDRDAEPRSASGKL